MGSAAVPTREDPAGRPATPKAEPRTPGLLVEFGELVHFALRALRALPGSFRYFSEILRVNAVVTRRTSFLLFIMCGFIGMSASNFGFFLLRSLGASDFVGIVPGLLTPRLLAPQMFSYVFTGSVCCAIAAELGSAKIQQEIDAYESEGIDPMQMLVGTRIIAVLLFVPLAAILALAGALAGSYFLIVIVLQGNTSTQLVDTFFSIFAPANLVYSTVTIAWVTIACVITACFYGMRTSGGPEAVGNTVGRSLAANLLILQIITSACVLIFYGGALALPIGD